MYWLVKTEMNKLEVWSDIQYTMMQKKCEYYGAQPFWEKIRSLEPTAFSNDYTSDEGEVMHYLEVVAKEVSLL